MVDQYQDIKRRANTLLKIYPLDAKLAELRQIESQMADPALYTRGQLLGCPTELVQRHGELAAELVPWIYMTAQMDGLDVVAYRIDEFAEDVNDLARTVCNLEFRILMSRKHASRPAILTIHARDGGTEAHDWCSKLAQMYTRWAALKNYETEILSQHESKAGISSMSIKINAPYAYGNLEGENGLHRLVRISPFNAQGKRQTSFAAVQVDPVLPVMVRTFTQADLGWDYFCAPGPGGQHKNKTESAVRLVHKPTGVTVTCVTDRSQNANKEGALSLLTSRLARLQDDEDRATRAAQRNEKPIVGFGSQIRSYFLHPKQRVTDARTGHKSMNFQAVLNGELQPFLDAYLVWNQIQGA